MAARSFCSRVVRLLPQTAASKVAMSAYALVAAATCVVGLRVVRTKWFYSGNYEENYFSGLQPVDAARFVALFVGVLAATTALLALYRLLFERVPLRSRSANPSVVFCVSWLVLFVCWTPYLLVNYPCALYADSIVIIKQALGINALSSHHPIAYVGLIGLFLRIGKALFDSYIVGISLYAAFQTVFMSGVFAYLLSWMAARRIPLGALAVCLVSLASLSIFPLHAASMWKDGLYASFALLFCLLVFDVVASRGEKLRRLSVLVRLALWGAGLCLLRSNGIYVLACSFLALAACYLLRSRGRVLLPALASLGLFFLVTGPVSAALDVKTEPVESYGIPLQQVASVVVYEGEMTEKQRAFLDSLLPIDQYAEEYIPCSVDGIKWAHDFDTEFFDSHQAEFMRTWAQLGLANPGLYFSAYVMESYEYWSFADYQRTFTLNGVNDKYDAPDLGIIETNLLVAWFGDGAKGLFPFKFFHLQEGAQSWIVLFAGLLLFVARREGWGSSAKRLHGRHARASSGSWVAVGPFARPWWLVLVPVVANWATVLVSSPFAALPRYILPAVFVLPVLLLLPWLVESCEEVEMSPISIDASGGRR